MHKPSRRMHTSAGRLLFAHRYPSGRRANFGVFSILEPKGTGTGPQNRVENPNSEPSAPQGSLIFYRMRLTAPDFRPKSRMHAHPAAENSQKCTPRPTPGERQPQNRARTSSWCAVFLQNCAGSLGPSSLWSPHPGAHRRTKEPPPHVVRSGGFFHVRGRTGKKGRPRAEHTRQLTRRCKPSCAYPRQHQTEYQSGSREVSS